VILDGAQLVPDLFRVHDNRDPLLALVETAGCVRAHAVSEPSA
jgi:hypothetical protein